MPSDFAENVPLAPYTSLHLGGPARFFQSATDEGQLIQALRQARQRGVPVLLLGGGSNLVIGDAGFDGLVVRVMTRGVSVKADDAGPARGGVNVEVAAGEPWDALVAMTVARNLAGLECLAGIPGQTGATPIQNVGAYGQEVGDTITSVRAYDRVADSVVDLDPPVCQFSYRDSVFRRDPDRFAVLSVRFRLIHDGAPAIRYAELQRRLVETPRPGLGAVRQAVLELRRGKSMVLDPDDENRRSAGSFFTNPIVSTDDAERVIQRALAQGLVADAAEVPRHPAGPDRVKLAAGWLIERAGIAKGWRMGSVGVSTRHALALVHHGGGTTADLVALARRVQQTVQARFGVTLMPEPTLVGVTL